MTTEAKGHLTHALTMLTFQASGLRGFSRQIRDKDLAELLAELADTEERVVSAIESAIKAD